ncbi:MAG: 50S ribosomal protein L32 [Chloroflexi bacterium]|nr:50S ribosomal protein L32 [Chloroflexota bacterium]
MPNSRRGKRRSHLRTPAVALTECPHCHNSRLPHHVCPTCGYYKGREAIGIAEPELPE